MNCLSYIEQYGVILLGRFGAEPRGVQCLRLGCLPTLLGIFESPGFYSPPVDVMSPSGQSVHLALLVDIRCKEPKPKKKKPQNHSIRDNEYIEILLNALLACVSTAARSPVHLGAPQTKHNGLMYLQYYCKLRGGLVWINADRLHVVLSERASRDQRCLLPAT